MKKIIIPILLFCLMAVIVIAPPVPFIVYGHVEWNEQLLTGAKLQLTNVETGYSEITQTDSYGYWQSDAGNFMSYGQTLKVKVLDGCGTTDTCEKSVKFNVDYAVIDFSITGTLSCPPCTCSCGGGGGGGGGGSSCTYYETKCKELYPCATCEPQNCPVCKICQVCPTCKECEVVTCPPEKVCPTCPEPFSLWEIIITLIMSFVAGGGAIYFKFGRKTKIKIMKVNGIDKVYHQHEGVAGFHNPDTTHRSEPHNKGELLPKYEQDSIGIWRYKE